MAATDVEIARLPANVEMRRPARSLWGDAWHQFTRHRLAMAGLFTFLFLIVFTLFGPLVYHTPINVIIATTMLTDTAPRTAFTPFSRRQALDASVRLSRGRRARGMKRL